MRQLHELLGDYEITKEPVMTPPGLRWTPYVTVAVAPYRVTQLPRCRVGGLQQALVRAQAGRSAERRAELGRADAAALDGVEFGRLSEWRAHRRSRLLAGAR